MAYSNLEQLTWKKLATGSYNNVFISSDEKYVLKIQRDDLCISDSILDVPERSVRIWNEINPDLIACEVEAEGKECWICPYIDGTEPSDEEISASIIDIFNRTGRIVTDANVRNNFKKTPEGRIICIDIGFALQLNQKEQKKLHRCKSVSSLESWATMEKVFKPFYFQASMFKPITTHTIMALLYIKNNRPNVNDVSFLDSALIELFAKAYRSNESEEILRILDDTLRINRHSVFPNELYKCGFFTKNLVAGAAVLAAATIYSLS